MRNAIEDSSNKRRRATVVLGLLCFWPLFRAPFRGTLFTEALPYSSAASTMFDVGVLLGGLALVVSALLARESWSSVRKAAFGAAMLVGGVWAMLAAAVFEIGSYGFVVFAALAAGGGLSALIALWASVVARTFSSDMLFDVTASFLLSFLLVVFDFSGALLRIVAAALPLGSCLALAIVLKGDAAHDVPCASEEAEAPLWPQVSGIALCTLGCLVVGLIASNCISSLWSYASGYTMRPLLLVTYLESGAMAAIFCAIAHTSKRVDWALLLSVFPLLLLLIVGICLCAFAGVGAGLGATATARTCFEFLLWMTVVWAFSHNARSLACGTGLYASLYGLILLSFSHAREIFDIGANTQADYLMPVSVASLIIVSLGLVAMISFVLYHVLKRSGIVEGAAALGARAAGSDDAHAGDVSDARVASAVLASGAADPVEEELLQTLRDSYALTSREAEIAMYLARGHSVKRIAETLVLSPNTVQGYVKVIYRKMGVHKKQSLIDAVEYLRAKTS